VDRTTSHVSFFVPTSLREALERSAAEHDRSLSAEIRVAIRLHISDPSGVSSPPSGVARLGGSGRSEP
jgi:hypothetical protein